jgi:hypothetical protein
VFWYSRLALSSPARRLVVAPHDVGGLEGAIDPTVALLHPPRVPGQIEVEEICTLGLEVHAFARRVGANEDADRMPPVVERLLDLLPIFLGHPAVQGEDAPLGSLGAGERRFELVNEVILGVGVLGEDEQGALEDSAPSAPEEGRARRSRRPG